MMMAITLGCCDASTFEERHPEWTSHRAADEKWVRSLEPQRHSSVIQQPQAHTQRAKPVKQSRPYHPTQQRETSPRRPMVPNEVSSAAIQWYMQANKAYWAWLNEKWNQAQRLPVPQRYEVEAAIVQIKEQLNADSDRYLAKIDRVNAAARPDPDQDFIDAVNRSRSNPNDCLIVATEAYTRLSKANAWARIAGFTISKNTKVIGGHAVVFFQPTSNSNVWMYDANGSRDLHTKSHDLAEILEAMSQLLNNNIQVSEPRWVEDQ
jgi:hypothetical protein